MTEVRGRDVDRGWAWVVLPAAALNLALEDAFQVAVGVFHVQFLETFLESEGYVALICAVCVCGQMIIGPVAGVLTDLLSFRVCIMLGGAVRSVALLCASYSQNLSALLLFYGIMAGTGAGLSYTPSATVVCTYFHQYRTIANGISLAAPGLGYLAGPYLLHWLTDSCGWRYAMGGFACLMAQTCVLAAFFFPHIPSRSCRPCCGRPPSKDDSAPKTETQGDADSFSSSNVDQRRAELEAMLGSKVTANATTCSNMELQILSGSGTDPGVVKESGTNQKLKARSMTHLEVKIGSRTDLHSKAGSRTDLQRRAVSRTALDRVSMFGSVMLNQSVERLREPTLESTPLTFRERVVRLLCQKFVWIILLNTFCLFCGFAIHIVMFPAFALSAGAAFKDIPAIYTAYGLTVSACRLAGGFTFSLIPKHLVHVYFGLQVALALLFVFLPVYGVGLPALYVGVVMIGATYGPTFLLLSPIMLQYGPLSDLSLTFGLVMLSGGLAFIVAPTVAGFMYDVFQRHSTSYYIAGSTVGAGTVPVLLLLFLKDLKPPDLQKDRGRTNHNNCNDAELQAANQKPCDTFG